MNRAEPADDEPARPRVLLHDMPGINRLSIHLLTRWTLPRIEIHIDSLPAVVVQMFQQRITRASNSTIGGLAVVLASVAVVAGLCNAWLTVHTMIWTSRQWGQYLVLVAIAALYAAVIGAAIGAVSRRARLVLLMRSLRRQLVPGKIAGVPGRYIGVDLPPFAARAGAAIQREDMADEVAIRRTVLSHRRRPKVVLRNVGDMKRILIHLVTHLKLPHVQISVDGVAPLEVQRAQYRVRLLTEACNCMLAATLAGAALLIGAFSAAWLRGYSWWVPENWGSLGLVSVMVMCAAVTGAVVEMIWIRVKLLLTLRAVRHQLGT